MTKSNNPNDKAKAKPALDTSEQSTDTPQANAPALLPDDVANNDQQKEAKPEKPINPKANANKQKVAEAPSVAQTTTIIKRSKLAIFSVLFALIAMATVGYLYWQQMQWQQVILTQQQASTESINQYKNRLESQVLSSLQTAQQNWQTSSDSQTANIKKLLDDLAKNYVDVDSEAALIDIHQILALASRHLWYENDREGALNLVELAQKRAQKFDGMKDTQWLKLQDLLAQDLGEIQSLPDHDQQAIYYQLTTLAQQVMSLPLNQVHIPEPIAEEEALTVSESIDDWRYNLLAIWRQLVKDFISVKRRVASVEPLLTPQQESNLRQNVLAKIVQAQTALLNHKGGIYERALKQANHWFTEYYQMDLSQVAKTSENMTALAHFELAARLPKIQLQSLRLLRKKLATKAQRQAIREDRIEDKVQQQIEAVDSAADSATPIIPTPKDNSVKAPKSNLPPSEDTVLTQEAL